MQEPYLYVFCCVDGASHLELRVRKSSLMREVWSSESGMGVCLVGGLTSLYLLKLRGRSKNLA